MYMYPAYSVNSAPLSGNLRPSRCLTDIARELRMLAMQGVTTANNLFQALSQRPPEDWGKHQVSRCVEDAIQKQRHLAPHQATIQVTTLPHNESFCFHGSYVLVHHLIQGLISYALHNSLTDTFITVNMAAQTLHIKYRQNKMNDESSLFDRFRNPRDPDLTLYCCKLITEHLGGTIKHHLAQDQQIELVVTFPIV